jgi:redox-sensing transcriptional repressor
VARLRRVVLDRLIRYYWRLAELMARGGTETITSQQLGSAMDVDPSQVRKDFAAVGLVGMSRVGFDLCEVCRTIRAELGFDQDYEAVLIGTGHLGSALLAYAGFQRYGLRIVAAFDSDPAKVGLRISGHSVQPTRDLEAFVHEHRVRLAILTTPVEVSQSMADRLVPAGVQAIWNFTPTRLRVPKGVLTRNEHISVGLAEIAYSLKSGGIPGAGGPACAPTAMRGDTLRPGATLETPAPEE